MARSLSKVQKKISKKRGGKPTALHENSRDAQRLRQAGLREDKLTRIASAASRSNRQYTDRIKWFREAVVETDDPLTDAEMQQLVEDFIARDEEELAELKAAQRPGRPRSRAEENLLQRMDAEQKELKSGFWIVEMRDVDAMEKLRNWGGTWSGLNTLRFVRVVKDSDTKPSSFPPKGLS